MHPWIATAIAVDIVINVMIVMWIMRRRGGASGASDTGPAGVAGGMSRLFAMDLTAVRKFSETAQPIVTEFMQSRYSGDPSSLPGVLGELLDRLEQESHTQGLTLDRSVIKSVMSQVIDRQHVARSGELSSAMEKVA